MDIFLITYIITFIFTMSVIIYQGYKFTGYLKTKNLSPEEFKTRMKYAFLASVPTFILTFLYLIR